MRGELRMLSSEYKVVRELLSHKMEDVGDYEFTIDIHAQISIAISLKRIADKLELSSKQPIIMNAEEYARYQHKLKEF